MSYTMTMDMTQQDVAWFEEARQAMSSAELGRLFVKFLRQQIAAMKATEAKSPEISPRVRALRGIVTLPSDFDEKEFKTQRLTEKYGL